MHAQLKRLVIGLVLAAAIPHLSAAESEDVHPGNNVPVSQTIMMSVGVPSSDLERSIEFYTVGLGLSQAGRIDMGRVTEVPLTFPAGGAGIMLLQAKDTTAELLPRDVMSRVTFQVPDLEALVRRLSKAGYLLDFQSEVPEYRVSVGILRDPDGNHIELVQRH